MRTPALLVALALAALAAAQPVRKDPATRSGGAAAAPNAARFDWFEYAGRDAVYDALRPGANDYLNPILAGFYPDPSLTRAGDDYYLISSTFAYFPGIPVFRSRDLVNWTQIGNVIDRPSQLAFDSLGMSRGVFAPTIEHHAGTFYVLNTCVDCGGNFIVTATNPAGPWSDPTWLPEVGGIDPSIFFDDDGKAYVINNDAPPGGSTYPGHRAIWIREYDVANKRVSGPATMIINGGVDLAQKPIWIEGPHIYKIGGRYYLSCAEGGTAVDHRQVVFRADDVRGPWVPAPAPINPILTQRHLDPARPDPITSAGHADFLQTPNGEWWGIFLATRPYEGDFYNTGRETFLLPLEWKDGWPTFVGGRAPIPYARRRPTLPPQPAPAIPTHGNFTVRDDFSARTLAPYWLQIRTPREPSVDLAATPGWLTLAARPVALSSRGQPSFVGRRQQHLTATATTAMRWTPTRDGDRAGLVAFQGENFHYVLAVGRERGTRVVQVIRRAGRGPSVADSVLASAPLAAPPNGTIYLRIAARRDRYDFAYATTPTRWTTLVKDADGKLLSTRTAGGFVGVVFGLHAYAAP